MEEPVPELPEVERARVALERRVVGRRIEAVGDHDTFVCRPFAPGQIAAALVGETITGVRRVGKQLLVDTTGPVLGLHLGMSGSLRVDEPTDLPFARFWVRFTDSGTLVLRDPRRLGRAVLDPAGRLGQDALLVPGPAFRGLVGRSRAPVKARLLDQGVVAGIGNLLADEVLWRARLDPRRPAGELRAEELDELRRHLRAAIRHAVRHGGVHTGEVVPHRTAGGHCPRCGAEMVRATVGGRTTWWCSAEQTRGVSGG
jgi:formamidopyrimidine-DNA glycosylase